METYAIYLPAQYDSSQSWPVIFFLDSHGRGTLPLEKYRLLADQFGYVLVGSNGSRNGLPGPTYLQLWEEMAADVFDHVSVDGNRIYAAGFSGGARVAALVAQEKGALAGTILCGAGYQPRNGKDAFEVALLVGIEDFNYQEMVAVEEAISQTGRYPLMEVFAGGHEWPPVTHMARAMQYMRIRAMAAGYIPVDEDLIQGMTDQFEEADAYYEELDASYARYLKRKKRMAYLRGFQGGQGEPQALTELKGDPAVKAELIRWQEDARMEIEMRNLYAPMLGTESLDKWRQLCAVLHKAADKGDRMTAWRHQRVLNFLSLQAYLFSARALGARDLQEAERYIGIYSLVDPRNPETAFMRAQLAELKQRPAEALVALQEAAELGFAEGDRLQAVGAFPSLQGRPEFLALIQQIESANP